MRIPSIIRQDGEYRASVSTLAEQLSANTPLPVVINGLSGGSQDAYLLEALAEARRLCGAPVVVFVGSDSERTRVAGLLSAWGIDARILCFITYQPLATLTARGFRCFCR